MSEITAFIGMTGSNIFYIVVPSHGECRIESKKEYPDQKHSLLIAIMNIYL